MVLFEFFVEVSGVEIFVMGPIEPEDGLDLGERRTFRVTIAVMIKNKKNRFFYFFSLECDFVGALLKKRKKIAFQNQAGKSQANCLDNLY